MISVLTNCRSEFCILATFQYCLFEFLRLRENCDAINLVHVIQCNDLGLFYALVLFGLQSFYTTSTQDFQNTTAFLFNVFPKPITIKAGPVTIT